MTAVCLAGVPHTQSKAAGDALNQAGVAKPLPIRRERAIDIDELQSRIRPLLDRGRSVGRVWEHLASELLLRNMDVPAWGWSIADPTRGILDFWAAHDPKIRFLIVYRSPLEHLEEAYSTGFDTRSCAELLQDWLEENQVKLSFYLEHPERSRLTSLSGFLREPESALTHFIEAGITAGEDQDSTPDHKTRAKDDIRRLFEYLVAQSVMSVPEDTLDEVRALYDELKAASPLIKTGEEDAHDAAWHRLDTASLRACSTTAGIQGLQTLLGDLARIRSERDAFAREAEKEKERTEQLVARMEELEAAKQRAERDLDARPGVEEKRALEQRLDKARNENEAMLLEVDRVQRSLETQAQSHRHTREEQASLRERLVRAARHRGAVHWEVKARSSETNTSGNRLDWTLYDALLGEEIYPVIEASTQLLGGNVILDFPWPSESGVQTTATSAVISAQRIDPRDTAGMRALSSTEYQNLQRLVGIFDALLPKLDLPSISVRRWKKALSRLVTAVEAHAETLRFDAVELRHEQINPDYEHLWLVLNNASFGQRQVGQWSFRIACADVSQERFGDYPKIEVPKQNESLLEAWFAEGPDEWSGEKLELRFALPDSMDKALWRRITAFDQRLVTGLIQRLPDMLQRLQDSGVTPHRSWVEWQKLVENVQTIYERKTAKRSRSASRRGGQESRS